MKISQILAKLPDKVSIEFVVGRNDCIKIYVEELDRHGGYHVVRTISRCDLDHDYGEERLVQLLDLMLGEVRRR